MNCLVLWSSAILFAIVAIVHVGRLVTKSKIILGSWSAPEWVSYIGIVIPLLLSIGLFRIIFQ